MPTSDDVEELLVATRDEMVSRFGISEREAVVRIDRHWHGQDLSGADA